MLGAARALRSERPVVGSWIALAQIFFIALVSVLPLGISADGVGLVPHLALAPLFLASFGENERVGPVGAFLAGFIVDVLTLAPLGVCAAAYLAFHAIVAREDAVLSDMPASARWLFFMPLAGGVAAVHIAAMMLVGDADLSRVDIAISLIATVLAYPAVSLMTLAVRRRHSGRARNIRA